MPGRKGSSESVGGCSLPLIFPRQVMLVFAVLPRPPTSSWFGRPSPQPLLSTRLQVPLITAFKSLEHQLTRRCEVRQRTPFTSRLALPFFCPGSSLPRGPHLVCIVGPHQASRPWFPATSSTPAASLRPAHAGPTVPPTLCTFPVLPNRSCPLRPSWSVAVLQDQLLIPICSLAPPLATVGPTEF